MGLAATRTKQRFGLDPRNTNWSNDTSRFGHKHLTKFGWKPGMGLGHQPFDSMVSHIKVSIKDDNTGLGAKIKKRNKDDVFDSEDSTGLDVFQRILGKLNGNESKIDAELEIQRKEKILHGRWGIHFVKADILASTWDPKTKALKSYSNTKSSKKRSRSDKNDKENSKKHKKHKKSEDKDDTKKHKSKKSRHANDSNKEKKKKSKGEHTSKNHKKEKKHKKESRSLEASETAAVMPEAVTTRLSVRSRWIKQKRAATMDAKALNEIFMITNS
ncbi:hypothetical protein KAFR_0C06490 [Kazachstania africana CBS 2517]|uniref:Protein PXR1 n=1 Tax=Kazachstania africana (strain ATCC 22294 / BCRC 22015 / CBS 2517 / CECT 1963 / NBRC 1671 / NRRL Y-8276) TaxID=1071382 RepID=H2ATE5_KAZAF|nr:hypothetical protein KAFR_0C06490 [Kazachstania africana CBS 2517]CCF57645.1 hypothetical protein KAFR_0C06490 [Kazachstania africana CBS 2517]